MIDYYTIDIINRYFIKKIHTLETSASQDTIR